MHLMLEIFCEAAYRPCRTQSPNLYIGLIPPASLRPNLKVEFWIKISLSVDMTVHYFILNVPRSLRKRS